MVLLHKVEWYVECLRGEAVVTSWKKMKGKSFGQGKVTRELDIGHCSCFPQVSVCTQKHWSNFFFFFYQASSPKQKQGPDRTRCYAYCLLTFEWLFLGLLAPKQMNPRAQICSCSMDPEEALCKYPLLFALLQTCVTKNVPLSWQNIDLTPVSVFSYPQLVLVAFVSYAGFAQPRKCAECLMTLLRTPFDLLWGDLWKHCFHRLQGVLWELR